MRIIIVMLITFLTVSNASARQFSPTKLTLSAPGIVYYNDTGHGNELIIPVTVSGTRAAVLFLVFTRNRADAINNVHNGHLGWHYVNKIDTCIYTSQPYQFNRGENMIIWDGTDQDGALAAPGEYTYYLFGYDNKSAKEIVSRYMPFLWDDTSNIVTLDDKGNPLDRPIIYGPANEWKPQVDPWERIRNKWIIGNDPEDKSLIETTLYSGWNEHCQVIPDPSDDYKFFITTIDNNLIGHMRKYAWVPNGEAELQFDWSEDGEFLWTVDSLPGEWCAHQPLQRVDNDLLVTTNTDFSGVSDESELIFVDVEDGYEMERIDLSDWWIRSEDGEAGAQRSGGPTDIDVMHGKLLLGSHTSCMNQVIDPYGDDEDEWNIWVNRNGDYVGDKNIVDYSKKPWACHDYEEAPYKYTVSFDDNLFSLFPVDGIGSVSFGLYAPDGTGVGYFSFNDETAGWKNGLHVVDYGSQYDGIYSNNSYYGDSGGWWYVTHDSFKGTIHTEPEVVDENSPDEFILAQNTPNPFNPATAVNFTIPEAGDVSIEVYNTAGQKVKTLAAEFMNAGSHSVIWNAGEYPAGIYFCTVTSGDFSDTIKMILLR